MSDDYDDGRSGISCYGLQEYPLIDEPRYISDDYDYKKDILFLLNAINFHPAWPDCEEFADLQFVEIQFDLQELFQLHSRVLLHKALDGLQNDGELAFLHNRPFSFYIREHDCEVMMLYLLN